MNNNVPATDAINIVRLHVQQIVNADGEYDYLGFQGNAQLTSAQYNDVNHGDAVRAWWDMDHSFGSLRAPVEVATAVEQLARLDLKALLTEIDASKNPNVMVLLSPRVGHGDDLPVGLAWLLTECSEALAALALMRCVKIVSMIARETAPTEATPPWRNSLRLIGDALACRPTSEEVNLWWQVVAIAPRLQGARSWPSSDFCNELHGEAARRLARHDLEATLPSPDRMKRYQAWNSSVAAVIPYMASYWLPQQGTLALAAFYRDVERRLWSELHEFPQVDAYFDMLYLEASGFAMTLEARWGTAACWRRSVLSKLLERSTCWDRDGSAAGAERIAYVVAAACLACLMLKDDVTLSRPVVDDVFGVVDELLSEWLWNLGFPSSVRKALPRILAHVCLLLPSEDGGARALRIAAEVRDSSLVNEIRNVVRSVLSDGQDETLVRLTEELQVYEDDLQRVSMPANGRS